MSFVSFEPHLKGPPRGAVLGHCRVEPSVHAELAPGHPDDVPTQVVVPHVVVLARLGSEPATNELLLKVKNIWVGRLQVRSLVPAMTFH